MNKYMALVDVNLRAMLVGFQGGSRKKKSAGIGALVLMAFIGIYVSGIYSIMLASQLHAAGLLALVPITMALAATLMSMFSTAFAASGIVFGSKDSDLMLSLPLSPYAVMLSKIMALYLENLVFTLFMMLPAGAVYLFYGGVGGVGFVIRFLLCNLFLPILPTFFALLIGFAIAYLQTKLGRHAIVQNLLYLVFFMGALVFGLNINRLSMTLIQNGAQVWNIFSTWLYPLGLYRDAIYGSTPAIFGFMLLMVLPFLLVVYLFSTKYKKILTMLSSTKSRSDYQLTAMRADGQFLSLFKKEVSRYFSTPMYLFNTGLGVISSIGAAGFTLYKKSTLDAILGEINGMQDIPVFALMALTAAFMCIMTCPANVSISLEGKTLWILREAPIPVRSIFLAKAGLNILFIWIIALVSVPILAYACSLSMLEGIALVFLCIAFGPFTAFSGLIINLIFPRMNAVNDTLVIKQSASAFCSVFFGMGVVLLGMVLYFPLSYVMSDIVYVFLCSILLLSLSAVMWSFLCNRGERMFMRL